MPEGPEIKLAAERVAKAIVGHRLAKVTFGLPELRIFEHRLVGRSVKRVDTKGKAMLTTFSNGLTLYSHNQLYGRWMITKGELANTNRSLRAGLFADGVAALLYSASDVALLTKTELRNHPFLRKLGPDTLDQSTTSTHVEAQLTDARHRRRRLGVLYLDQRFLAGVGNYLRSEILFFAGLHYGRSAESLTSVERRRLGRASLSICRRAYRTRGVTNSPSLVRELKRQGKPYERYRFAVFSRKGKPCYRCGTPIVRTSVSSRRLYFCPQCQPAN